MTNIAINTVTTVVSTAAAIITRKSYGYQGGLKHQGGSKRRHFQRHFSSLLSVHHC